MTARGFAWLGPDTGSVRAAAWVARCVGRGSMAPLRPEDVDALARYLEPRSFPPGSVLFSAGRPQTGVWIIRNGTVELSTGSGPRRAVVALIYTGDVDGDIHLLLEMPPPYTARSIGQVDVLYLSAEAFDRLLAQHPLIARRWLSSVAGRVSAAQQRLIGLLGVGLTEQTARLLLAETEAGGGPVELPQRVLAAMLGVQRSSLNKVLREFEQQGLITLGYRTIEVADTPRLTAVARVS